MTARAQAMGLDAMVCQEANQAISDVDLVVSSITLTYETAPFLDARRLRKGAFAAITDLGIPWHGDSLQAFDALFVDDLAQETCMEKPLVAPAWIRGDMASLVSGRDAVGFERHRRSAFVFRGLSIADLAVAALAWERARQRGSRPCPKPA